MLQNAVLLNVAMNLGMVFSLTDHSFLNSCAAYVLSEIWPGSPSCYLKTWAQQVQSKKGCIAGIVRRNPQKGPILPPSFRLAIDVQDPPTNIGSIDLLYNSISG